MNNHTLQQIILGLVFSILLPFWGVSANEPVQKSFVELVELGDTAFQQGNFPQAIQYWENSQTLFDCPQNVKPYHIRQCMDVLTRLAAAYLAMKQHNAVFPKLEHALFLAKQTQDLKRRVLTRVQFSDALLSMKQMLAIETSNVAKPKDNELEYWQKTCSLTCASVTEAKALNDPLVLAKAFNNYGNWLMVLKDHFLRSSSNTALKAAIEACLLTNSQKTDTHKMGASCEWEQMLTDEDDSSFLTTLNEFSTAYDAYQKISVDGKQTKGLEELIVNSMKRLKETLTMVKQQLPTAAMQAYQKSAQLAEQQTGGTTLAIQASLNRLRIGLMTESSLTEVVLDLNQVWQQMATLPNHYEKMKNWLSFGTLALNVLQEDQLLRKVFGETSAIQETLLLRLTPAEKQQVIKQAYSAFQKAVTMAHQFQDNHTLAMAYGYWGQLYEQAQRYDEALTLTRRAIFFANQSQALATEQEQASLIHHFSHFLYQWYWQQGRIFKQQGKLDQAIASYRLASYNLKPIQQILEVGYRLPIGLFERVVKPVHYGLADLLLQKVTILDHAPKIQQQLIKEAINAVERIKIAELQKYFDECVLALHAKTTSLLDLNQKIDFDHNLLQKTALLYPIPLEDRLVMLFKILDQDTIYHKIVPINAEKLNQTIKQFRFQLQKRTHNGFLEQAQALYQWLISPIETQLNGVDTLIVVPDSALRMIPLATLHDGQRFLIEKYAMVLAPGLTLVDPKPINWDNTKILLAGLSEAVQGYPGLPSIPSELMNLQCLTQGVADKNLTVKTKTSDCKQDTKARIDNQLLFNQDFSMEKFEGFLKQEQYAIIHLATHGEFDADPDYTYLLTYQEKMKLDRLEKVIGLSRFREENPLELLTLSACKTAVGNDKAALGLAGVAVKAGARSALATLWYVEDSATSKAMSEFYRQLLTTPNLSKAKALQRAQKALIAQDYYWHPGYWGPFLLIGNWL